METSEILVIIFLSLAITFTVGAIINQWDWIIERIAWKVVWLMNF